VRDAVRKPEDAVSRWWSTLEPVFRDARLGPGVKLAFARLWWWGGSGPGQVVVASRILGAEFGASDRAARKWITKMVEARLIEIVDRDDQRGTIRIELQPIGALIRRRPITGSSQQEFDFEKEGGADADRADSSETIRLRRGNAAGEPGAPADLCARKGPDLCARKGPAPPGDGSPRARSGTGTGTGTEAVRDQERTELDRLDLETALLAEAPELRGVRGKVVEPLPAKRLVHSVFHPLQERHLRSPITLVEWFRRQLGAPRPATEASEAALLLVLAAARHVMTLPASDIKKNSTALFVRIVGRANWRRVLPELPDARRDLDGLLKENPTLLTGPWPGSGGNGAKERAPVTRASGESHIRPLSEATPGEREEARQALRAAREALVRAKYCSSDGGAL